MVLRKVALAVLFIAAIGGESPAVAEVPKGRTITIVVPFSPGSGVDIFGRILAPQLRDRMGQPVIVDNRTGASGNIGTQSVAQSRPDGTTLLLTANTIVMNAGLFKSLPYDPVKSFSPIAEIGTGHMALVSNVSFPARTLPELIEHARQRPGIVNYASPGNGTPHHLAMELLKISAQIELTHVPYPNVARAMSEVVGGHVGTMFVSLTSVLPHVQNKRVRLLGIASKRRVNLAPDAVTIAEQGFPGFEVGIWHGVFAPAGTPASAVHQLNRALNDVLSLPEVRGFMAKQGIEPGGGDPERLQALVAQDLKKWSEVIQRSGIKAE